MGGGGSDNSAREAEERRQQQIRQGTQAVDRAFAGFTPEFYQQRQQSYLDWASPQLEDQYSQAQKDLTFALARQFGSLDTSVAADRQAKLAAQRAMAESQLGSQAMDYERQSKEAIENQRAALLSQVQAGTNPASAAKMAAQQSQLLSQPQTYSELGNLFANVTEGLAAANYPYGVGGGGTAPTTYGKKSGTAVKPSQAARIVT